MSWCVYAISKDISIIDLMEGSMLFADSDEWNYLYIGVTNDFDRRMDEHYRDAHNESYEWSQKFYRHIRNKWDDFDKTILVNNITSEQEAKDLEIELIAKYNSYKNGMNSTRGGDGASPGADNHRARAIRVYNNSTGEETSYDCITECAKELKLSRKRIDNVLSSVRITDTQSMSTTGIRYQFKRIEDTTSFIENMPSWHEKHVGTNNYGAREIRVFNNSTNEEVGPYTCIAECARKLKLSENGIYQVLYKNNPASQVKSDHDVWYQIKYIEDTSPFIVNMLPPNEKKMGGRNYNAKPICAFGKLYDSASSAGRSLIEVVDTININFIIAWIYHKKIRRTFFMFPKSFMNRIRIRMIE
ncbi:GIY-YIG catalytic domain-containing endonuclease [Paramecium bursaria Chlorella virus MA1D]|nr:GIY-YIG catalytic domain-containing endonuclease [Paramecium bursaria Chlorella virus MA1D]